MNINNILENTVSRYKDPEGNIIWSDVILNTYEQIIKELYPDYVRKWPIINGISRVQSFDLPGEYIAFLYVNSPMANVSFGGGGELTPEDIGLSIVQDHNLNKVREYFYTNLNLNEGDGLFILNRNLSNLPSEIQLNIKRHKRFLGLTPMKIFLSHKTADKPKVREFKRILEQIGFDSWLDEEELAAGDHLEKSLFNGMKNSCAAIFFLTENYKDTNYLESEITYAINRKREDPKFALIALKLSSNAIVPDLLTPYVYKEPTSDLEALSQIIKAIPAKIGKVIYQ
ncbi:toll/interleukin-1 receptor domain-containing protein [Aggregatibacter actinomycetemcomitans]|uniref:toll/interleukin-1 receptor domain-containing protein n=1 Tax=Aggregatibacter actinomycetemcomitans TaxID=714 RepID=UPI00197B5238|nr:toll/interleukin-1 receptor domain-containing protein [Aggregatibacter actinomycetemcomitans]MBN6077343.1 toll/interleukin-1 receptor domain-containing protein [Aggregatibacter actinomycetemcomitans]